MIQTPLYSIQSRAMRIQSLALQLSSLTTKFHTLNCSIIPTSNTLDQLINSGLHIPVIFLDEQDRLEAAGQEMNSGETIKFYLALMDQHKESDEIWFDQRTLEAEIDRLRRDVDFQISSTQLSIDRFNSIRAKLDPILSQQSTQKAQIEGNARVLAPRSKNFLDQSELNQSIILNLCLGSDWGVRLYKLVIGTLESFEVQKQLMNNCKERLTHLIESVNDLDHLYPSRHWELLDSECLKVGPKERDYKEAYKVLNLEL
ncbi:hypothetical protein PPACK8108_LOCUS20540 [Phakopsora pachyrhizi]|uniref:Uncharacterized protein n=1 Tax=Phakopsora pachyrhizi TaxID=170000 RepID=A0AAV0BF96_PHAPC|nr:hypothetical protein PPACK8108_LOCUS20540 [Phakopsora pachyrhizi]